MIPQLFRLMLRTKPQFIGDRRDRSGGSGVYACSVACGSLATGITLMSVEGSYVSSDILIVMATAAVAVLTAGACVSEYLSVAESVYAAFYRRTGEASAFLVGWTSLLSSAAVTAAIAGAFAEHVNAASGLAISGFMEPVLGAYFNGSWSATVSVIFGVLASLGLKKWFRLALPLALGLSLTSFILDKNVALLMNQYIFTTDQALHLSSLSMMFFADYRVASQKKAFLMPLNIVCLTVPGCLIFVPKEWTHPSEIVPHSLSAICLFILGLNAFHSMHEVIHEMASDGLLFRCLSKRPSVIAALSCIAATSLCFFSALLLPVVVLSPLLINSFVPFLVLANKYCDTTSWQYTSVLTGSLPPNPDNDDTTSSSSDTDIDDAVTEHRNNQTVATATTLQQPSHHKPPPTRLPLVIILLLFCLTVVQAMVAQLSMWWSFGCLVVVAVLLLGWLLGLRRYLPWNAGAAAMVNSVLLGRCLRECWQIYTGWIVVGLLLYFIYGIRSSTAAISFRPMTHISLSPLPSYGNSCLTQIVPAQRKKRRS